MNERTGTVADRLARLGLQLPPPPAPCPSRRTGCPPCPPSAWWRRRSWSAPLGPPAAHEHDGGRKPRTVRPENSKDPGAAAGTEPAQPPLSSIELMLKSCGKPRNWCITSTTRCSLILSTVPTGPELNGYWSRDISAAVSLDTPSGTGVLGSSS